MLTTTQHHAVQVYGRHAFTFYVFFILGPDQLHALTASGTALSTARVCQLQHISLSLFYAFKYLFTEKGFVGVSTL